MSNWRKVKADLGSSQGDDGSGGRNDEQELNGPPSGLHECEIRNI